MLCWYLQAFVFWIPWRWRLGTETCRNFICHAWFSDILYAFVGYCNYLLEQDVIYHNLSTERIQAVSISSAVSLKCSFKYRVVNYKSDLLPQPSMGSVHCSVMFISSPTWTYPPAWSCLLTIGVPQRPISWSSQPERSLPHVKLKIKVTLVQALWLCTGRTCPYGE
jgi:hypothetical protein